MLTIGHGFLQQGAYTSMSQLSDSVKEILKHISDDICSSSEPSVSFEPTKYRIDSSVCSSMTHSFTITDLCGLVKLLGQGINVYISVSKLVYSKGDQLKEDSPSVARKQLTSAKGNKSGRTSTQSGVSSTVKVNDNLLQAVCMMYIVYNVLTQRLSISAALESCVIGPQCYCMHQSFIETCGSKHKTCKRKNHSGSRKEVIRRRMENSEDHFLQARS